jgi:arylformamidase
LAEIFLESQKNNSYMNRGYFTLTVLTLLTMTLFSFDATHESDKNDSISKQNRPGDQEVGNDVFIDLSHTIEHGLVTYKGLPAPIICDYLSRENSKKFYAEGTEFQIGKIEMVANTGTYIDCPFHRYENGKDLSEMGLEAFTDLDAIVVKVPFTERLEITEEHFKNLKIKNKAVLIYTGWDKNWNTEKYYDNHPYLTEGAAKYLKDSGAKLVGIDSHNIDSTTGKTRPVHTTLLGAEILIVEHLCNMQSLPKDGFKFSAIPPKFKGVGTFPVRAMAKLKK